LGLFWPFWGFFGPKTGQCGMIGPFLTLFWAFFGPKKWANRHDRAKMTPFIGKNHAFLGSNPPKNGKKTLSFGVFCTIKGRFSGLGSIPIDFIWGFSSFFDCAQKNYGGDLTFFSAANQKRRKTPDQLNWKSAFFANSTPN
jgi:hypothetical protein